MTNKFDRFTKQARQVLTHAQEEAQLMNHGYIGTEHLLLGLLHEESEVPAKVLREAGVELPKTRAVVEEMVGKGKRGQFGRVSLTPRTKRVIELAMDEARNLGHPGIGPEHLLLGLLREGNGLGIDALQKMGVSTQALRERTIEQMPQLAESESPSTIYTEINALLALVGTSKDLSDEKGREVSEALQVVADQLHAQRPNKLVVKGILLGIELVVADAPDIAEPALNSIAILMRSMS